MLWFRDPGEVVPLRGLSRGAVFGGEVRVPTIPLTTPVLRGCEDGVEPRGRGEGE
jgi:hypothetical protein